MPELTDTHVELLRLLKKPKFRPELCESLGGISDSILQAFVDDLRHHGYQVMELGGELSLRTSVATETRNELHLDWNGDKVLRFGVVSDTHLGSKYQQLTHLNTIYDTFVKEGIDTVYNPGDLTDGLKMRRGHEYEVFIHSADELGDYVIAKYPKRKGITTYYITGNHDHAMIQHLGVDIGIRIAREREDMKYLGQANAKVLLTPNCIVELNHPLDGAAYALSYAPQKTIDAMSGGEKPNILLNGHHHKLFYMLYRNIHAFEAGTLQAQTSWMRGKRIAANVGGWIIEVHVNSDGSITRCIGEIIPFYKAIEHDY
jgi:predicted phosphodiesterase